MAVAGAITYCSVANSAIGRGDEAEGDFFPTGHHAAAEEARAARAEAASSLPVRVGRHLDEFSESILTAFWRASLLGADRSSS
jgi:hypothetical protein